jgi:cellulose synthase/poly-beta-1,6-N-acetylglucosamine synthase-like glycosyltransferase
MVTLLSFVLWGSIAMVVFVTIGYPLLLILTMPIVRGRRIDEQLEPSVSLIIAAFNEESVIAEKLSNCLDLEYPRDKLSVIVASDGSTDQTNDIARSFESSGVTLICFPRTGKTGVQNRVANAAAGEILVFSDANALYRPDAIRKLVRNFSDPDVGGVCGQLDYVVDNEGAGNSERTYWRYEKFIKRRESELSSVVGANGSIYAVRRSDYVQLDEDMISDFVEPLALVRSGKRVVYEALAVSMEAGSTSYGTEYRRKVRILTRSIRGLLRMRQLLNPLNFGIFAFQLILHKLLRFLTPAFLIAGSIALAGLAVLGQFRPLFLIAVALVAAALIVTRRQASVRPSIFVRACHLLYYYLMANYALLLAWRNVLRGDRMTTWSPERVRNSR